MAAGNQPSDRVDREIDRTAMARVLDLTDDFELIVDRVDDRPFA